MPLEDLEDGARVLESFVPLDLAVLQGRTAAAVLLGAAVVPGVAVTGALLPGLPTRSPPWPA